MEEAQRLCDRVAIMDHGRMLDLDRVDALIARHGGRSVVKAELVRPPADASVLPAPLDGLALRFESERPLEEVARLTSAGVAFQTLEVARPDLETVFLTLTGRSLRDCRDRCALPNRLDAPTPIRAICSRKQSVIRQDRSHKPSHAQHPHHGRQGSRAHDARPAWAFLHHRLPGAHGAVLRLDVQRHRRSGGGSEIEVAVVDEDGSDVSGDSSSRSTTKGRCRPKARATRRSTASAAATSSA